MFDISTIITLLGILSTLGGIIVAAQSIGKSLKKARDEQAAFILQEAKEAISLVRAELETSIKQNAWELENLKNDIDKDLGHLKESYRAEIKNLGDKIEELRTQVTQQHGSIVNLLSKLIDK
jgi:sensor domain CHASE-containing protein